MDDWTGHLPPQFRLPFCFAFDSSAWIKPFNLLAVPVLRSLSFGRWRSSFFFFRGKLFAAALLSHMFRLRFPIPFLGIENFCACPCSRSCLSFLPALLALFSCSFSFFFEWNVYQVVWISWSWTSSWSDIRLQLDRRLSLPVDRRVPSLAYRLYEYRGPRSLAIKVSLGSRSRAWLCSTQPFFMQVRGLGIWVQLAQVCACYSDGIAFWSTWDC